MMKITDTRVVVIKSGVAQGSKPIYFSGFYQGMGAVHDWSSLSIPPLEQERGFYQANYIAAVMLLVFLFGSSLT